MAKVFTQEEREKIKGQVVELVRLSGRETLRQLEAKKHPPCTEEQAEWLIHNYRRRGYEIKKALSLDYRHWIISVRLPYSERPPRPSRTFQQRIWR